MLETARWTRPSSAPRSSLRRSGAPLSFAERPFACARITWSYRDDAMRHRDDSRQRDSRDTTYAVHTWYVFGYRGMLALSPCRRGRCPKLSAWRGWPWCTSRSRRSWRLLGTRPPVPPPAQNEKKKTNAAQSNTATQHNTTQHNTSNRNTARRNKTRHGKIRERRRGRNERAVKRVRECRCPPWARARLIANGKSLTKRRATHAPMKRPRRDISNQGHRFRCVCALPPPWANSYAVGFAVS